MRTINQLAEVIELVLQLEAAGQPLYVRYTRSLAADRRGGWQSTNHQTGRAEGGLSVNNLVWDACLYVNQPENKPRDIATALTEYIYLGGRPYLLTGREIGRGADNEPLLTDVSPVAWVGPAALAEALQVAP